jgi:hypothetical protein
MYNEGRQPPLVNNKEKTSGKKQADRLSRVSRWGATLSSANCRKNAGQIVSAEPGPALKTSTENQYTVPALAGRRDGLSASPPL